MFVKTILAEKGPELIRISHNASIRDAAQLFKIERIGFAIVEDNHHDPIGTVSERDIVQALALYADINGMKVADVMTRNLVSVGPEEPLETVRELMTERRTRHVLVKDGGELIGIVSIGDLIKHSLAECQVDSVQMRDYISGTGYQ
ncbi:CBS domain-containing protein [Magnetovibrio sp.]|uniref:CBS domain-containing protein n=1 Tax=Magnetovibrio sp. TaxID=2024836 RepID=UPI002F94E840